jgi:hypothetical protein
MGFQWRKDDETTIDGGRRVVTERTPDGTTITQVDNGDAAVPAATTRIEPVTKRVAAPAAYEVRPALTSLAARMGLSIVGAAMMIVGAFLNWFDGVFRANGPGLGFNALWPTGSFRREGPFYESIAFIFLMLGLIALLGLASRSGALTRLAGALGLVAFVMYTVRLFRADEAFVPESIGIGAWLALAGSLTALIGGFMGTAREVVVPEETMVVTGGRANWAA